MKLVIQRCLHSSVAVEEKIIGEIGKGLNILACVTVNDSPENISKAAKKVLALRIFADENGRMNKSITDIGGQILAISQFTLSWDGRKGNRPSFDLSMAPERAKELFDQFCHVLEAGGVDVKRGEFGANMAVDIKNDGPVTFSLEF